MLIERQAIRGFIRRHGAPKTLAISTLVLVLLASLLAVVIDLLVHATIHVESVVFSALITCLAGPPILYSFIGLISQLDRSEEKLRALSVMDDLTDVYNRRFFLELAERELAKARRYNTLFSLLIADIDHFRRINDLNGHRAGDAVLQAAANTCMNNLRAMDIFGRAGGDQFMFLIPESDKIDVEAFANKVLGALENTTVAYEKREIRFTASIGVKTFDQETRTLDALLKAAGEALAEAKRQGRNCIVVYDSPRSPHRSSAGDAGKGSTEDTEITEY